VSFEELEVVLFGVQKSSCELNFRDCAFSKLRLPRDFFLFSSMVDQCHVIFNGFEFAYGPEGHSLPSCSC
jgi:hypothetical protein